MTGGGESKQTAVQGYVMRNWQARRVALMQGLQAHLHGLRIKVGLGFAGAIASAALLPAVVSAPASSALSSGAQVAQHLAPTATAQTAGAGWSAPVAQLTGAGWSRPVSKPNGAGWS